jgi:hypothetical protein
LDFDRAAAHRARNVARGDDLDGVVGEARDVAAVCAEEVRMLDAVRFPPRSHELESPHVVAHVGARDQSDLDQITEVSVDRDAIDPGRRELLGDLRVA